VTRIHSRFKVCTISGRSNPGITCSNSILATGFIIFYSTQFSSSPPLTEHYTISAVETSRSLKLTKTWKLILYGNVTYWTARVRFTARTRDFSLLYSAQNGPVVSCGQRHLCMQTNQSLSSTTEVKSGGAIPPPPTRLHDVGTTYLTILQQTLQSIFILHIFCVSECSIISKLTNVYSSPPSPPARNLF
jgi:hypothetical protein